MAYSNVQQSFMQAVLAYTNRLPAEQKKLSDTIIQSTSELMPKLQRDARDPNIDLKIDTAIGDSCPREAERLKKQAKEEILSIYNRCFPSR